MASGDSLIDRASPGDDAAHQPGSDGGSGLDVRHIIRLALRTLPYLRPVLRELRPLVPVILISFILGLPGSMLLTDLTLTRMLGGEPLTMFEASFLRLDPAHFVEIKQLSVGHTRMGAPSTIAQKPTFQRDYIRAEARLHAARLLVIDVFSGVLDMAKEGGTAGIEERAMMRTAASYATEAAKNAVDFAHEVAGTTSIRNGHALQRCFRDMHTGTQHTFIGEETYLQSSEVFLGLRDESPFL
jgi:hypothetical protein